jgi:hypothetical protein
MFGAYKRREKYFLIRKERNTYEGHAFENEHRMEHFSIQHFILVSVEKYEIV